MITFCLRVSAIVLVSTTIVRHGTRWIMVIFTHDVAETGNLQDYTVLNLRDNFHWVLWLKANVSNKEVSLRRAPSKFPAGGRVPPVLSWRSLTPRGALNASLNSASFFADNLFMGDWLLSFNYMLYANSPSNIQREWGYKRHSESTKEKQHMKSVVQRESKVFSSRTRFNKASHNSFSSHDQTI